MKKKRKTKTWSTRMHLTTPERFIRLKQDSKLEWADYWEQIADQLETNKQQKLL